MNKQKIQQLVDSLSDDVDIEVLIERLYLLRRLELAEQEIEEGKVLDHEDVEKRFATWLE